MKAKTFVLLGLVLFVILSLIDLAQTWALITGHDGRIYEGNPVARLVLKRFGWSGLVLFKVLVTVTVIGAVMLLIRQRPRAALLVLIFACLMLLYVTLYSSDLLKVPFPEPRQVPLAPQEEPPLIPGRPNAEPIGEPP
ncbi:MAG TPA: DUF5658 family protein [Gemmataceae bacterium]|nr:DUF5658 family protein [Gemmataceae bacterium]